jgi:hypothetical protein
VIRITAAEPVIYVPDNVTPHSYVPGEYYDVPPHVAAGLCGRGQAELAGGGPGEGGSPQPSGPEPDSQPGRPQPQPGGPTPGDENGDENGGRKPARGARAAR